MCLLIKVLVLVCTEDLKYGFSEMLLIHTTLLGGGTAAELVF